jgi:hypothetical protein
MASENDIIFFGILVGSITMILKMIIRSCEKAKKTNLCYGFIDVERDVNAEVSSRENSESDMIPASFGTIRPIITRTRSS